MWQKPVLYFIKHLALIWMFVVRQIYSERSAICCLCHPGREYEGNRYLIDHLSGVLRYPFSYKLRQGMAFHATWAIVSSHCSESVEASWDRLRCSVNCSCFLCMEVAEKDYARAAWRESQRRKSRKRFTDNKLLTKDVELESNQDRYEERIYWKMNIYNHLRRSWIAQCKNGTGTGKVTQFQSRSPDNILPYRQELTWLSYCKNLFIQTGHSIFAQGVTTLHYVGPNSSS